MNYLFKTPLILAVFSLALHPKPAFAETRSDSTSTAPSQNQKTSAKSADQPEAKPSATTPRSESLKEPAAAGKEDDALPRSVAAPQGPVLFKLIDTDKNGRLSSAEFIAYGAASTPAPSTSGSVKTSPSGAARSELPSEPTPSDASTKSAPTNKAHSANEPSPKPAPASPDAGILSSTNTRAGRYTAEVFEILDINHDKFLTQAELDALIPAHQVSQP